MESGTAGEVLRSIGSKERMALLRTLLRGARPVSEPVDECGFGSTGQVYHHLRPMVGADLVDTKYRPQDRSASAGERQYGDENAAQAVWGA